MSCAAVFLDRDGTINMEVDHLTDPAYLQLLPGSARAIKMLNDAGIPVIVISNQAGIARGLFTEETLGIINDRLVSMLEVEGAKIDGMYYCPHHPEFGNDVYKKVCQCRKPSPGMLLNAADDLDIELTRSYMVGDTKNDILAGKAAGCRTILVRTGYGEAEMLVMGDTADGPDLVCKDIREAVLHILKELGRM